MPLASAGSVLGYLSHGWVDAVAARTAVDDAEARGVDAGLCATWRLTIEQCRADFDSDSLQALTEYVQRYTAAGSFTQTTPADDLVAAGLDAATTVRDGAAGLEAVLLLVVGVFLFASFYRR